MPNNSVNSKPEEKTVLQSLEGGTPKSIKEIAKTLSAQSPNPERLAREVAWKLVEEGKARFNADWLLEARSESKQHDS